MDRFVLKEKLPLRTVVMVLLRLSGVLVILLDDILFSKAAVGQVEQDQARNTTLGNFICLLNPVSWSFYWMIVRRAQKQRDTVAASKSLDASQNPAAAQDEEHWWDEMLAIQIVAAVLTALFSCIGMMASGWSEQVATVQSSDVPVYIIFGMYIPFVLLMFSLAPRYIATAEMGCIKMLGASAFAHASYYVVNVIGLNTWSPADRSCLRPFDTPLTRAARTPTETITGPVWVWLYDGETPNSAAYFGGAIIITAVIGHSIATMRAGDGSVSTGVKDGEAEGEQKDTETAP